MDYIVIVLFFGIIGLYAWYAFKKPQIIEEINTSNKKQTENTCFIQSMEYADKKQDSRTDAIMKELGAIHFWVAIIGFYTLIKLIEKIIQIILLLTAGYQANELLKMFFNSTLQI